MWDVSQHGRHVSFPCPLALEGRLLITELPGKSLLVIVELGLKFRRENYLAVQWLGLRTLTAKDPGISQSLVEELSLTNHRVQQKKFRRNEISKTQSLELSVF